MNIKKYVVLLIALFLIMSSSIFSKVNAESKPIGVYISAIDPLSKKYIAGADVLILRGDGTIIGIYKTSGDGPIFVEIKDKNQLHRVSIYTKNAYSFQEFRLSEISQNINIELIPILESIDFNKYIETMVHDVNGGTILPDEDFSYKDFTQSKKIFSKDNYSYISRFSDYTGNMNSKIGGLTYSIYAEEDIDYMDGISGTYISKGEKIATIQEYEKYNQQLDYPSYYNNILYLNSKITSNNNYFEINDHKVSLYKSKYKIVIEDFDAKKLLNNYASLQLDALLPFQKEYFIDVTKGSIVIDLFLERPTINIEIEKTDKDTNNGIKNARFGIYNKTPINFYSFSKENGYKLFDSSTMDNLLEIVTTDEKGIANISLDLPVGEYYIKEFLSDNSYEITDEIFKIDATFRDSTSKNYDFKIKTNSNKIYLPTPEVDPEPPIAPDVPVIPDPEPPIVPDSPITPEIPKEPTVSIVPIVPNISNTPSISEDKSLKDDISAPITSVVTGDNSNINLYIVLLITSLMFIIGLEMKKKQK